jgi:hypothetical protein
MITYVSTRNRLRGDILSKTTCGKSCAGADALGGGGGEVSEVKEQRQKMRKEETVTFDLLHNAVPARHTDERL